MKPFIIFTFLAMTVMTSVTITSSNNILAKTAVREIVIGPDMSKNGDDVYTPANVTIKKGDKVIWTNKDFGIHTVTENKGLFGSKDLRPDQMFEHTFESGGTYGYHCKLHPDMVGKIVVN